MPYTKSQMVGEIESLLNSMVREVEKRAECEKCKSDDVYVSGKDDFARSYAQKIGDLVGKKIGLS